MSGPEPPPPPGEPTRPTEPLRPPAPVQPRRPAVPPPVERLPPDYPAGYPPEDPRASNPWAAVVTGLLGLLVGGLIGYLVGNSGESTKTVANRPAVTHTVTSTKTVPGPTKVETVTQKTVTQAPASPESERQLERAEEKASSLEKENEELRKAEKP